MPASSKQKYSKTLAFPNAYYESFSNLGQSVELFCAYDCSAISVPPLCLKQQKQHHKHTTYGTVSSSTLYIFNQSTVCHILYLHRIHGLTNYSNFIILNPHVNQKLRCLYCLSTVFLLFFFFTYNSILPNFPSLILFTNNFYTLPVFSIYAIFTK